MKTTLVRLISLLLAIMPMVAVAQTNVKSAFDAIINCKDAKITEFHNLDKDPLTGVKAGQCDIYDFILPANKLNLVKNVISAFGKDNQEAYSINSGVASAKDSEMILAVKDATGGGVRVNDPEREYIYALFLPSKKEDPEGIHRYAYGMNYKEEGGKIVGKFFVTYATTLQYRQQLEMERQSDLRRGYSNGSIVITTSDNDSQQSWFDTIMSYFQGMTSASSQTRIALATKAYKLIGRVDKYPDVTNADKNAVREVVKGMLSDKKYSETVLNRLLNQCLVELQ